MACAQISRSILRPTAPITCGPDGLRVDCCPSEPTLDSAQPGDFLFYAGIGLRTGYTDADGSLLSRGIFTNLWDALSLASSTASSVIGTPNITGIASTKFMRTGMEVEATDFPAGMTIVTVDSPTAITVSANATLGNIGTVEVRVIRTDPETRNYLRSPNLDRKFPLGYDNSDPVGETLGFAAGEEDHTLTVDELAAHDHNVLANQSPHTHTGTTDGVGNHNHGTATAGRLFVEAEAATDLQLRFQSDAGGDTDLVVDANDPNTDFGQKSDASTGLDGAHSHTFTTDSTDPAIAVTEDSIGGDDPHNNMPPYIVGRWLIHT